MVTSAPEISMLLQHDLIIHLVDVVAGEDYHIFRRAVADDVDVLKNGVGGAGVPLALGHALARRHNVETFIAARPKEIPAAGQMPDEAVRFVLRRDADAANSGIQRVREREVDDAHFAAKIDRRFGAAIRQFD